AGCIMVALTFAASINFGVSYHRAGATSSWFAGVGLGTFYVTRLTPPDRSRETWKVHKGLARITGPRWTPEVARTPGTLDIVIPLWIPLVLLAGLACWARRMEGRNLHAHCAACGY